MKRFFQKYYIDMFFNDRLFVLIGVNVTLFLLRFFFVWIGIIPNIFLLALVVAMAADLLLLFRRAGGVSAHRGTGRRLSNGDDNPVDISIQNQYGFKTTIAVIDEVPMQFQVRDKYFHLQLPPYGSSTISYVLKPKKRGEYQFGRLRVFVSSPIGLLKRRFNIGEPVVLPVYPSFLKLRQFELMAVSNNLSEYGIKKMRKLGHSMEFDQVKGYVGGDDIRTINWKATARKGDLMVNAFVDEKSQQIYSVVDKSRAMRMPFEGLSLLDYAINSTVALSRVAMLKEDKAGLITIGEKLGTIVAADKKPGHFNNIMQALYNERTRYLETNMELLYSAIRNKITQRSLIVFYTNFESMSAMRRQLPFLRRIAKYHLLLVVFFENTELTALSSEHAPDLEGIYRKAVAEKFILEKKMIVKELMQHGILSLLTPPKELSVRVVNRYLALKAAHKI